VGSVLVVGDRGSGLTTFLGLLYAAQLRLGTEEEDEFRFSADRETIRQLEAIYGELVAGRFPEWDIDWEAHPLSFVFGFRAGRFGRIGGHGIDGDRGFDTVRVQVGGIPADEVSELAEHDAVLEESTRRMLRSPVVVPLVDASRLPPRSEGAKTPALSRYDRMLAGTLHLVGQFLAAERNRKLRTMYPLFVVTKFDRCHPETLTEIGAPKESPAAWPSGVREAVGDRILERYFPATRLFFLGANGTQTASVVAPLWFYSSLQLESGSVPLRILRRSRVPVGGWEPEYPFEEYRILIEHLAKLAHQLPPLVENA
jgi:hypothetical protein